MVTLSAQPDSACLRVIACSPAFGEQLQAEFCIALDKLFQVFVSEGRCTHPSFEFVHSGAFCLITWQGADLSGCSKDKIARLLSHYEERSGASLLVPPPIAMATAEGVAFMNQAAFKAAVHNGDVTEATELFDPMLTQLGEWRARGKRPLSDHWALPLFKRATAS